MTAAVDPAEVTGPEVAGVLPDFLVVGAPRCGTSALFAFLADHPEVASSSVKEVQYFMDEGSVLFRGRANYAHHGLAAYHEFFRDGLRQRPGARVVFEATPGYMYQQTALTALAVLPTRPRLLFQLRKPSEQLYSSYIYSLNGAGNLPRDVTFREFAFGSERLAASDNEFHRNALAFTDYQTFLARWRAACGDERIRVSSFEHFRDDPRRYLRELAEWLGIASGFYDDYHFAVVNESVAVRSRRVGGVARRLSAVLPGQLHAHGRRLYRSTNMKPAVGPTAAEVVVMAEIDERMSGAEARLAAEFGVDFGQRSRP